MPELSSAPKRAMFFRSTLVKPAVLAPPKPSLTSLSTKTSPAPSVPTSSLASAPPQCSTSLPPTAASCPTSIPATSLDRCFTKTISFVSPFRSTPAARLSTIAPVLAWTSTTKKSQSTACASLWLQPPGAVSRSMRKTWGPSQRALRQALRNSGQSYFQSPGTRAKSEQCVGTPSGPRSTTPRLCTKQISLTGFFEFATDDEPS